MKTEKVDQAAASQVLAVPGFEPPPSGESHPLALRLPKESTTPCATGRDTGLLSLLLMASTASSPSLGISGWLELRRPGSDAHVWEAPVGRSRASELPTSADPDAARGFSPRTGLGKRLWEQRQRIVASGERLLDWDGVRAESARRRGEAGDGGTS